VFAGISPDSSGITEDGLPGTAIVGRNDSASAAGRTTGADR
jgi:hypothetical protein